MKNLPDIRQHYQLANINWCIIWVKNCLRSTELEQKCFKFALSKNKFLLARERTFLQSKIISGRYQITACYLVLEFLKGKKSYSHIPQNKHDLRVVNRLTKNMIGFKIFGDI